MISLHQSGDVPGIVKQSTKLGVGQYYGLFACMVAARTFDKIANEGIGSGAEIDVSYTSHTLPTHSTYFPHSI